MNSNPIVSAFLIIMVCTLCFFLIGPDEPSDIVRQQPEKRLSSPIHQDKAANGTVLSHIDNHSQTLDTFSNNKISSTIPSYSEHDPEGLYYENSYADEESYDIHPASSPVSLLSPVVDPDIIKNFNQDDPLFSEIWQVKVNFETMPSLEKGTVFSLPDFENSGVNIFLSKKQVEILETSEGHLREVIFYTGELIGAHSAGNLFSGAHYTENGHTYLMGEYNTSSGTYRLTTDENNPENIYLMVYNSDQLKRQTH